MKYRPEIDGLRALAVVPVILFHAGVDAFSGGYVGVDVFFVISGFLITSILADDLAADRFSIVTFYERRARRILPALFLVILACLPLAWIYLPAAPLSDFSQSVAATTLFGSNILFWMEADYFDRAAELKPLLHTWSLAVEEQFYIVFPLLLFVLWKIGVASRFGVLTIIALASLALAQYGAYRYPDATFYLLPTRAWELLAGSLAALAVRTERGRRWSESDAGLVSQVLSLLGITLIVASIILYDKGTPFPSLYALAPVGGTVLLILAARQGSIAHWLLSRPLFVGIGLISYSAYLWHQPLLVFFRYDQLRELHPWEIPVYLLVVVVLSYLSWKFVEAPFRSRRRFSRRAIFSVSAQASAAAIACGVIGWQLNGFPNRGVDFLDLDIAGYNADNEELQEESWGLLQDLSGNPYYTVEDNPFDRELWFDLDDHRPKMLIVGNSHSKDLYNALTFSRTAAARYQVARFGAQVDAVAEGASDLYDTPNYLAADIVVICTRYASLAQIDSLYAIHDQVAADGKRLIIVNQVFEFYGFHHLTRQDQLLEEFSDAYDFETDGAVVGERINKIHFEDFAAGRSRTPDNMDRRRRIEAIAAELQAPLVDRMDLVCDGERAVCHATDAGYAKHFYDYGHYTLDGAAFFGARIDAVDWLDGFSQAAS